VTEYDWHAAIPTAITVERVETWKARRLNEGRSPSTVLRDLFTLSGVLRRAVKAGELTENQKILCGALISRALIAEARCAFSIRPKNRCCETYGAATAVCPEVEKSDTWPRQTALIMPGSRVRVPSLSTNPNQCDTEAGRICLVAASAG
jgi:hypothetical protein